MPYPYDAERYFEWLSGNDFVLKSKAPARQQFVLERDGKEGIIVPSAKPAMPKKFSKGYSGAKKGRGKSALKKFVRKEASLCMQKLAEKKHVTTGINSTIAVAGTLFYPFILSQGNSQITRVGNQIRADYLELRVELVTPAASPYGVVRCIIGKDSQPNGAGVTVTDLLEAATYQQPYNRNNVGMRGMARQRFSILHDSVHDLMQTSATVTSRAKRLVKRLSLKNMIFYQSNAGTISDLMRNNIFVLFLSANGTETATGTLQVCYTDF